MSGYFAIKVQAPGGAAAVEQRFGTFLEAAQPISARWGVTMFSLTPLSGLPDMYGATVVIDMAQAVVAAAGTSLHFDTAEQLFEAFITSTRPGLYGLAFSPLEPAVVPEAFVTPRSL